MRLTSIPTSIRVAASWVPPYALPSSGQAVLIGNTARAVKPSTHTDDDWDYALFSYYGGGALVEDFSAGGAFVIAGSGGHAVPPNFGGCVFDFADATWKRIDNANGMPWRNRDLSSSEINSFGEIAISGVAPGIPGPAHLYGNMVPLPASRGGGPKGSLLILRHQAMDVNSSTGSGYAHRFDLSTGLWTRHSSNATSVPYDTRWVFYDPVADRYYLNSASMAGSMPMSYLSGATRSFTGFSTGNFGSTANTLGGFFDPQSRLLVYHAGDGTLRAFNVDNWGAGATTLKTSGTVSNDGERIWARNPSDGCWYSYMGKGEGNVLSKIQPPTTTNPLTGTWACSTVAIGGARLAPQPARSIQGGAGHHNRFFYVPSLQCFAWIADSYTQVALIRP